MNDAIRMQLSAFVDGELPENEAELLLRRLSQDAELRQEVAEFMAIGRLIRGEAGLAGADRLNERIAAEIDDRPIEVDAADASAVSRPIVRPLVGAAIAATVALVAILGLQQMGTVDAVVPPTQVAEDATVVPEHTAQQEQQRQFLANHADSSSESGANGMNSRLVNLEFSRELEEAADGETDDDEVAEEVDNDEASVQP